MPPMSPPRFEKVVPLPRFPELEAGIRSLWKREDVFRRSLAQREGAPRFVFYEGPPTANGMPHNGHVLTRVIKDVFPRYKTMRGFHVPRKAGWDTHGLPVEIEVEKSLRISGKAAIEAYGVEPFVRQCLESVFRYTAEWEELTDKLAFWVDLDNAYVTFHESYVESVWWALSELHRRGHLYRGHKVVWWWARGGTVLSAAEVGEGYRTVDDPSVYVLLPLEEEPDLHLVVWTTTPWTLPSNTFAAVRPEVEYAILRDGDRRLVVAEPLRASLEATLSRELPVLRRIRGEELVGRRYRPPFDWFRNHPAAERIFRVVAADFVELDAGTGIVHIAPAFGEVDFELLRREQQTDPQLPLLCAVRPDGTFDPELAAPHLLGRFVKDCDRDLIRELRDRGLLLHAGTIRHEYPFCVRAENDPLIQYARPAWYIRTSAHVDEALAQNALIRWLPEHIRDGRFGDFLRNNVDWALSRERYWGTPLNLWINDETGAVDAPASVAEILDRNPGAFDAFEEARRRDRSLSPHLRVHKPWIDQVTWTRPGEPGVYRRVPEVIDAWFDSGSMPFAQWGWPHRGREEFERSFPADFISEAIDQTRGWFNSLLWISTLLFPEREKPHPYRTCLVLGHVCDRSGRKESKSRGNYTPPDVILDRVRLEFAVAEGSESPPPGVARIAREDYEGLDLRGARTRVRAYPPGQEAAAVELDLEPAELPRRVVLLAREDREGLRREIAPHGLDTRPGEVPQLPEAARLVMEDPASPAPGADAFRWFFFSAGPPWNPTRHSLGAVRASQRELPLKLRNVFSFFTIYANIDGFDPASQEARRGRRPARERALLDRWILSEREIATREVIRRMDDFHLYEATQILTELVDGLSNWYVRRSRERFWTEGLGQDKLDAHWTLYECLVGLARLLAPFLPYATEEMWQNLVRGPFGEEEPTSVHLADYPDPDPELIDEALSRTMRLLRELASLGLQVRTAHKLKVRQPLAAAEIALAEPELRPALEQHLDLLADELNVRRIHFLEKPDAYVRYRVRPNFRALGPRVGRRMPALKRALEEADGARVLAELEREGRVRIEVAGEVLELGPEEISVALEAREGYAAAAGRPGVIVLHTEITPELRAEGLFREVVNRVQATRKELDLEYTGRIRLVLDGAPELLAAVEPRKERLARETLAVEVRTGAPLEDGFHVRDFEIEGLPLVIGLARV